MAMSELSRFFAARNFIGTGYGPAHWQWVADIRRGPKQASASSTRRRRLAIANVSRNHSDLSGAL